MQLPQVGDPCKVILDDFGEYLQFKGPFFREFLHEQFFHVLVFG